MSKSLYQKVYFKKFILKSFKKFTRMKHCLYIHQDYQPPKCSLYHLGKISCELGHFPHVLYAKCYCTTMSNVFY